MAREQSTLWGSGTLPFLGGILASGVRGYSNDPLAMGVRTATQVCVANPEDIISVDAWASSGISVTTAPVKIFGASQTILPRTRMLRIQNGTDSSTLLISNDPNKVVSEGWQLVNGAATVGPRAFIDIPIMAGTDVWAAASSSTVNVKMIMF